MTTLTHTTPLTRPVVVSVTVRLDLGLLFWPLFAAAWLVWLGVARLGRWLRNCREWWAAAGTVARRRWRRWVDRNERRFVWTFGGLWYGPVLGVG